MNTVTTPSSSPHFATRQRKLAGIEALPWPEQLNGSVQIAAHFRSHLRQKHRVLINGQPVSRVRSRHGVLLFCISGTWRALRLRQDQLRVETGRTAK